MNLIQATRERAILAVWGATCSLLVSPIPTAAQAGEGMGYESRYVEVGGSTLHYAHYGGAGMPLVFISYAGQGGCPPGARCGPSFWGDFPRGFVDVSRVLALAPRGVGESKAAGTVATVWSHADDIIAFFDAVGIERAVLVGTRGSLPLTSVAERYPARVAGVVFLSPGRQLEGFIDADTTRSVEMMMRIEGEHTLHRSRALAEYQPYARDSGSTIDVPTLTFVTASGTAGLEKLPITPLEIAEHVARAGADFISDVVAREYFTRLSLDAQLQARVESIWTELIIPGLLEEERAFTRAFGDNLEAVPLDVPVVSGKEFETAADLIRPHIKRFVNTIEVRH
jgi:pimeloyl-ACP methyl ester carboxylesterase